MQILIHIGTKKALQSCHTVYLSPRSEAKASGCGLVNTAPSLQRTSYLCSALLCEASSIFHRQVWYHALSLCYVRAMRVIAYSTFRHHPHPLGYPCAKFHFCHSLHCWASPWRKITYSRLTHSITHSITHPDYL